MLCRCSKKLSTQKERMWEQFFTVRTSSFEDMWEEFLIGCGTDASTTVYQHVTDIIFKDLLLKQFSAAGLEKRKPICMFSSISMKRTHWGMWVAIASWLQSTSARSQWYKMILSGGGWCTAISCSILASSNFKEVVFKRSKHFCGL